MGKLYLYNVPGVVEEVCTFSKAVLSFTVADAATQRVLMWVKNFVHEGKVLEHTDSLHHKLKVGDSVTFHCHIYDRKDENRDKCSWFAARAWRSGEAEEPFTVVNQPGDLEEVEASRAVLTFTFFDKKQRVFFLKSKYHHFEQRASRKYPLTELLTNDCYVHFDACSCTPTAENKMCSWIAKGVWKGKKPQGLNTAYQFEGAGGGGRQQEVEEDMRVSGGTEECKGAGQKGAMIEDEWPLELSGRVAAARKQHIDGLYKGFEVSGATPEKGNGRIVLLLSEEAGVALWMPSPNCWESVFFHRTHAFLDHIPLAKYSLMEPYAKGTLLQIVAVPAVPGFPCKWIARRVVATS